MRMNVNVLARRAGCLLISAAWASAGVAAPVSPDQNIFTGLGETQWRLRNTTGTSTGEPFTGSCGGAPGLGIRDANSANGAGDAYDDAWMIFVEGNHFIAPDPVDLTGTTYTAGPAPMSGLNVTVQYHFFTDRQLARIVAVLANPTGAPITTTLEVPVNFGSDGGTVIRGTSSGDQAFTVDDRWVVTSDAGPWDPVNTTVFYGPGNPPVMPDFVTNTVFGCAGTQGAGAGFNASITVPPGQQRALMFFAGLGDIEGQGNTIDEALANAPLLFDDTAALNGLGLLEGLPVATGEILNWEFTPPVPQDFGDAPAPYPTTLAANGARHAVTGNGPALGAVAPDAESNGLPSALADGDDSSNIDDEDAVYGFVATVGDRTGITVVDVSRAPGYLDAWIDFNGDGDWDDPGEQIAVSAFLSVGRNTLMFDIPAGTTLNTWFFGRFRISSSGGLATTGAAADGEVEDHRLYGSQQPPAAPPGDSNTTGAGGTTTVVRRSSGAGAIPFAMLAAFGLAALWRRRAGAGNPAR